MKIDEEAIAKERAEAWIGDAVLALFAREWLLKRGDEIDGAAFTHLTSNKFLRLFGRPTAVEAEIGRLYQSTDLATAFSHLESNLVPRFIAEEKNLKKQAMHRTKRKA